MLLGQRVLRPICCTRRGASSSQAAIAAKMPPKALRRIKGSLASMSGIARGLLAPGRSAHAPPLIFPPVDFAPGVALIQNVARRAHPPPAIVAAAAEPSHQHHDQRYQQ